MELATVLAERLMSQYEDRLPLARISEEILAVLGEGGVRIGDPVPDDLAGEVRRRLDLAAGARVRLQSSRRGLGVGPLRSPQRGDVLT